MDRGSVKPSRRHVLAGAAALALPLSARAAEAAEPSGPVLTRPIPSSGELLPMVGLGTAIVFDVGDDAAKRVERREVVEALVEGGGKLIDTAPAYGTAEPVVGDLVAETGLRRRVFLATKVSIQDRAASLAEMQASLDRLKTKTVDLVQLWNVRDPKQDLGPLREWKAAGHCRYIGITTSVDHSQEALTEILKREKPDFVQVNYSIGNRDAEADVLPAAKEVGAAVLVNLPFGRGGLFRLVRGKSLPDWAAEFDATSWGQFFLKYILANDAVTVAIPGTNNAEHMKDNLGAAHGRLPDAAMRAKMIEYVKGLG